MEFDIDWYGIVMIAIVIFVLFCLLIFIALFIIFPIAFKCSIKLKRMVMFTNVCLPSKQSDFEVVVPGLKNLYVNYKDSKGHEIKLGVWHYLPAILNENCDFNQALQNSGFDVIVYCHGAGETRLDSCVSAGILRNFFHVICFDYRCYGDSTSSSDLNEISVVEDCVALYKWIRRKTDRNIYVWGRSLGSALSAHMVAKLKSDGLIPKGLILEAPFTTMREEIPKHPYGKIFAWLPWFDATISNPLAKSGMRFKTSENILKVDCPIMLLHAIDDSVVPISLGYKLYEIATFARDSSQGKAIFHEFPRGCDHYWINKSPMLPQFVGDFIKICTDNGTHS